MKLGKFVAAVVVAGALALMPVGAASAKSNGPKKAGCQHHCNEGNDQNQNQGQSQNQEQDQEQHQCFIVLGLLQPASCDGTP